MWTSISGRHRMQSVRRKFISHLLTQNRILTSFQRHHQKVVSSWRPLHPNPHHAQRVSADWLSFMMAPPSALRMWNMLENEHWMTCRWRMFSAAEEVGADTTTLVRRTFLSFPFFFDENNNFLFGVVVDLWYGTIAVVYPPSDWYQLFLQNEISPRKRNP